MDKKIIDVFKRVFDSENIDENTSQKNLAKWDSLGHLNLVVELEDEFDISFEPEEIAAMKDVKIVEEIVNKKK